MPGFNARSVSLWLAAQTGNTTPAVEWSWVAGRFVIALVILAALAGAFPGFEGAGPIVATCAAVIAYSAALALLLTRGRVLLAFRLGIVLDFAVVTAGWWWTARTIDPALADNDMWLAILPAVITGVVRLGPALGVVYTGMWLGIFAWLTIGYRLPGSYALDQLPLRLSFVAIVGVMSAWLAAQLKRERNSADELRRHAEKIGEIGRVVGSSLDVSSVIDAAAVMLRQLIPYDRFSVLEFDRVTGAMTLMRAVGDGASALKPGSSTRLSELTVRELTLRRKEILFDESACRAEYSSSPVRNDELCAATRSMIAVPVIAGDEIVGALVIRSATPAVFTNEHLRILCMVGEYVGSAVANARLYAQTVQLHTEREARLNLTLRNRELQQRHDARTLFLSSVTHELKTPLTSIVSFTDLLLRNKYGGIADQEIVQLQTVKRSAAHLCAMVDDLLALAYVESGKMSLEVETFPADALVRDVCDELRSIFDQRHQVVRIRRSGPPAMVYGDRRRIAQVISNLLSNASKYSPVKSEIVIGWQEQDGGIEFTVIDKGSGIPAGDLPYLFQPFYRAAEHRKSQVPGTGLGLVISKSLVEAHGGEIRVDSIEGRGTIVEVWLPSQAESGARGAPKAA